MRQQKIKDALMDLNQALDYDKSLNDAFYFKSKALLLNGDTQMALKTANQVDGRDPRLSFLKALINIAILESLKTLADVSESNNLQCKDQVLVLTKEAISHLEKTLNDLPYLP